MGIPLLSFRIAVAVALVTYCSLRGGRVAGQVCSGVGHMCMRTTDCCRGCCEGYQCVDRSFPCSGDLGPQGAGSNSCDKYFCPVGQICFLVEVCPAGRGCPRKPACRRFTTSETYARQPYNSASESGHSHDLMLLLLLALVVLENTLPL